MKDVEYYFVLKIPKANITQLLTSSSILQILKTFLY